MYFFTRDTLGRTFYNAIDRFIVKEIIDENKIHILQIETSTATTSGWILLFNSTRDKVTQKFDEIISKAKQTALQKQIDVIDFFDEE